jgi:Tol biopolymer transport system component
MSTKFISLTRFDIGIFVISLMLILAIGITVIFAIPQDVLRVAYLRLDERGFYQLFIADPFDLNNKRQLTSLPRGVFDFDTSPDGRHIVYTARDAQTFHADLYLLDVDTGRVRMLTNCKGEDSDCFAPVYSPTGAYIAYERVPLNNDIGTGIGNPRIWLIDARSGDMQTFPLINETQILGTGAVWSGDGAVIAFYDNASGGIITYRLADGQMQFVPSSFGVVGALSPNGDRIIYSEMTFDGATSTSRAYLQIADLANGVSQILTDPSEQVDDQFSAWRPNSQQVAIGRRYMDERYTRGAQIYLIDTRTAQTTPLLIDPRYSSGFFVWDPSGEKLVMQRFQQVGDDGLPYSQGTTEVWVYELTTQRLIKVDENSRNPRWLP